MAIKHLGHLVCPADSRFLQPEVRHLPLATLLARAVLAYLHIHSRHLDGMTPFLRLRENPSRATVCLPARHHLRPRSPNRLLIRAMLIVSSRCRLSPSAMRFAIRFAIRSSSRCRAIAMASRVAPSAEASSRICRTRSLDNPYLLPICSKVHSGGPILMATISAILFSILGIASKRYHHLKIFVNNVVDKYSRYLYYWVHGS